jgi:hypothetical protein
LTTTAHGEVDIQRRKSMADITFGDNIERRREIKNMIVKREIATVPDDQD